MNIETYKGIPGVLSGHKNFFDISKQIHVLDGLWATSIGDERHLSTKSFNKCDNTHIWRLQ